MQCQRQASRGEHICFLWGRDAYYLSGRRDQPVQVLIVIAEDQGRVVNVPDIVNTHARTRNQKDSAVLRNIGYRILNSLEFLIRPASWNVTHHTPIPYLVSGNGLFPHPPLDK